jgi:hypothetical protein
MESIPFYTAKRGKFARKTGVLHMARADRNPPLARAEKGPVTLLKGVVNRERNRPKVHFSVLVFRGPLLPPAAAIFMAVMGILSMSRARVGTGVAPGRANSSRTVDQTTIARLGGGQARRLSATMPAFRPG